MDNQNGLDFSIKHIRLTSNRFMHWTYFLEALVVSGLGQSNLAPLKYLLSQKSVVSPHSIRTCGALGRNDLLGGTVISPVHDLSDNPGIQLCAHHCLHHCQMLKIIVGLEQCISREEFYQDASYTPDVTRKAPPQSQDNFRRPIMPCRYDCRVIFIIKCCGTKVNQPNLCIK